MMHLGNGDMENCRKFGMKQNVNKPGAIVLLLVSIWTTKKCITFKDIFSRTLSFNFQDFPSRTKVIFRDFPAAGIFKKKIQDFPGGVETLPKWEAERQHHFVHISKYLKKTVFPDYSNLLQFLDSVELMHHCTANAAAAMPKVIIQ